MNDPSCPPRQGGFFMAIWLALFERKFLLDLLAFDGKMWMTFQQWQYAIASCCLSSDQTSENHGLLWKVKMNGDEGEAASAYECKDDLPLLAMTPTSWWWLPCSDLTWTNESVARTWRTIVEANDLNRRSTGLKRYSAKNLGPMRFCSLVRSIDLNSR